jgi:hypothetical protein
MKYRNDLDECLTYFKLLFNFPKFRILFFGYPKLLSALSLIIRQQGAQATRELRYINYAI